MHGEYVLSHDGTFNVVEETLKRMRTRREIDSLVKEGILEGSVNEENMHQYIQDVEIFKTQDKDKKESKFDVQKVQQLRYRFGLSGPEFEEIVKTNIKIQRFETFIKQKVRLSDGELRKGFELANEKFLMHRLDFTTQSDNAKFLDLKAKEYFDANQDKFPAPRSVKAEVVSFIPEMFRHKVDQQSLAPEIVNIFMKDKKKYLEKSTELHVRQIYIKVLDFKNEKEVNDKNQKALFLHTELKNGEDFTELAKKSSQNAFRAKGGDMGWISDELRYRRIFSAVSALLRP